MLPHLFQPREAAPSGIVGARRCRREVAQSTQKGHGDCPWIGTPLAKNSQTGLIVTTGSSRRRVYRGNSRRTGLRSLPVPLRGGLTWREVHDARNRANVAIAGRCGPVPGNGSVPQVPSRPQRATSASRRAAAHRRSSATMWCPRSTVWDRVTLLATPPLQRWPGMRPPAHRSCGRHGDPRRTRRRSCQKKRSR